MICSLFASFEHCINKGYQDQCNGRLLVNFPPLVYLIVLIDNYNMNYLYHFSDINIWVDLFLSSVEIDIYHLQSVPWINQLELLQSDSLVPILLSSIHSYYSQSIFSSCMVKSCWLRPQSIGLSFEKVISYWDSFEFTPKLYIHFITPLEW